MTAKAGIGHNGGPPIAWDAIKGTSQERAYKSFADVTLYHGARGPGKTDVQLMKFRKTVGAGYGAHWRGIIFDREYKNLDDLIAKSKRWFPTMQGPPCQFLESKADYKWKWATGEELLFRSIKVAADYWNYHGQEYPFIGWNELCKYPTLELFDKLMSCNRTSFVPELHTPDWVKKLRRSEGEPELLPELPMQVFATTNPFGPGHNAVKHRFISVARNGEMVRKSIPIFNPRTQKDEIHVRTQMAIFGSWRENKFLPPAYIAELASITDPNLRAAWESGSWDIVAGGALDDVWLKARHVLPRFTPPPTWHVDRSFDWGSTHPYSVGFWAEANGEEATLPDGSKFCPPPGSLIQLGELYGATEFGTNRGNRMGSTEIAEAIIAYEDSLIENGWLHGEPWPGPADNQIRSVTDTATDTLEKKMADLGIRWTTSDKSPHSRKIGLQLIRDRLHAAKARTDEPHLYFMANCRASIETVPIIPRDEDKPDDVDTESEDHAYDMVRYRVLAGNSRAARSIRVKHAA